MISCNAASNSAAYFALIVAAGAQLDTVTAASPELWAADGIAAGPPLRDAPRADAPAVTVFPGPLGAIAASWQAERFNLAGEWLLGLALQCAS